MRKISLNRTRIYTNETCMPILVRDDIHPRLVHAVGLKEHLNSGSQIILIARITPLMMKRLEAGFRLIDDIYTFAIEKNYTIFRLGEGRDIILPPQARVITTRLQKLSS